MAFKFRLQALLDMRAEQRDRKRILVAEARQAQAIVLSQIEEKDRELADMRQEMAARLTGTISVDTLLSYRRFEIVLVQQRNELEQNLQQISQELERRENTLVQADIEVKQIEKLQEAALHQHQTEERKQAQAEMDEVASVMGHLARMKRKERQG